jgi:hypothetical protein
MKPLRIIAPLAAVAALAGFYAWLAYVALNPVVSEAYRAYYILKNTPDWRPRRYSIPLDEGIDFTRSGYPDFVARTEGLSEVGPSGRWTDAKYGRTPRIVYARDFQGQVCLSFLAHPSPSLAGLPVEMMFGDAKVSFQAAPVCGWQHFPLNLTSPAHVLDIRIKQLTERPIWMPYSLYGGRRHLGLLHVTIMPGHCPQQP